MVRPFDCFSGGKFDQKAAACCKKGKCSPSNPDDCCKAAVAGGNQLVAAEATDHSVPVLAAVAVNIPHTTIQSSALALFVEIDQPPGSPPNLRSNLPLLI
jgi:hypothetical protein